MSQTKIDFISREFPAFLRTLEASVKGSWGKMNAIQMTEHMTMAVRMATGTERHQQFTPEDQVLKYKEFAMSDKAFRENTKNVLLPDEPEPARSASLQEAIKDYEKAATDFLNFFRENPGATLMNPIFGKLNFEEWVHLLDKHARHHARQFGMNA